MAGATVPAPPPAHSSAATTVRGTGVLPSSEVAVGRRAFAILAAARTTRAVAVSAADGLTLAEIASAVSPSVVSVHISGAQSSQGSGVVIDEAGLILTNAHVIETGRSGCTNEVGFADGTTANATVVATDTTSDVAVLRAEGVTGLIAATLGTSSHVATGDTVLAFGSPLGLGGTVTSGIVSTINRDIDSTEVAMSGLIQTDAAINPGNSGGPLVNAAGEVIGINVAIATTGEDSGNIGVGFAIPIDTVRSVLNDLVGAAY